jgi:hypothetical protein
MQNLIYAAVLLFGGWWLIRKFARTPANKMAVTMRKIGGGALMAIAGLLAMRGAINAAVPIFFLGAGLFGLAGGMPGGFNWGQRSTGQKSRVETSLLAMELDHDSGQMEGMVKAGPLRGRTISGLSDGELRELFSQAAATSDQSQALLEAWLDRSRPGWRDTWQGGGQQNRASQTSGTMTRDEAYAVLGLKPGASEDEIRKAHKRLMKEFHPDRGGSDYLAAKINQAKDVLLHP